MCAFSIHRNPVSPATERGTRYVAEFVAIDGIKEHTIYGSEVDASATKSLLRTSLRPCVPPFGPRTRHGANIKSLLWSSFSEAVAVVDDVLPLRLASREHTRARTIFQVHTNVSCANNNNNDDTTTESMATVRTYRNDVGCLAQRNLFSVFFSKNKIRWKKKSLNGVLLVINPKGQSMFHFCRCRREFRGNR